jgi:hypothetical protein
MDRLGLQLAELAEEAAGKAHAAGAAAARRRGARRRRRQATGVVVLIAALIAGLVWVDQRPLPSASPTRGWKTYTDTSGNLRFRYPAGWTIQHLPEVPGRVFLVPPEDAGRPSGKARYLVSVDVTPSFWVGEWWIRAAPVTKGRLPDGQPYLHQVTEPLVRPGQDTASDLTWFSEGYSIDWGRYCTTSNGRRSCGPHTVTVSSRTASRSAWNRYRGVVDAIARSATPLRPTGPSVGDRSRPACRPDQWRLVWPGEHGYSGDHEERFVHQGGVRYRQGPPCHLRLTLRLTLVDAAGRRLPVAGNPATTTVEGDLPEDQIPWLRGSWVIEGALMWRFAWEGWCNKGLPPATLRVTASGGATLASPGPGSTSRLGNSGLCRDTGRPSTLAGWPQ